MVTSAVVTLPESQEAIQSAVQILSSVQNPESFGVDQANLDACIAGLSALQPVGASCSNVGASCSISEAAEATSTKKADEEETIALQPVGSSCSNVGDSCSISDNTKKAAAAAVPEAANTAVHEEGISKAAKSRSRATKTPGLPTRRSARLNAAAVEPNAAIEPNAAVEPGDVTSPIKSPIKKLAKKNKKSKKNVDEPSSPCYCKLLPSYDAAGCQCVTSAVF
jgi:hypothetical protein